MGRRDVSVAALRRAGASEVHADLLDNFSFDAGAQEISTEGLTGSWAWNLAAASALQIAVCSRSDRHKAVPILSRPSDLNFDDGLAHVASR